MGYIAGVGALNADFIGRSRETPVMRDSNPGFARLNAGGVTRNILENLARMGMECRLISAVGADAMGQTVLSATREAGVDVSRTLVVQGAATSSYCAILDPAGDMFIALSDMRILEHVNESYLDECAALLRCADAVVLDPSLPLSAIEHVLTLAQGAPVIADPVSTHYAKKLLGITGSFFALKPNRMELEILTGMPCDTPAALRRAAEALVNTGCKRVYVTLGAEGCAYVDDAGNYLRMKLRPALRMENATGAGDAFTAAAVLSIVRGYAPERSVSLALAAGLAAALSPATVEPAMSLTLLERILSENPPAFC